jgi:hypothetical protein
MKDEHLADPESDTSDCITITDRAARRRFIRTGSAFLLGGATVGASLATSSQALAADCDQNRGEEKPEQAGNGSDSDSGAGADPAGCGRRQEEPKLSKLPSRPHRVGSLKS